jgi:M6 family metalloprotease-like protein
MSLVFLTGPVVLGAPALFAKNQTVRNAYVERARPLATAIGAEHKPVMGSLPTLVILASFTDQPAVGTDAKYWNQTYFGSVNSVKDYYREVSYGQLQLVPASETFGTANDGIVGWIKLPYSHPNPGDEVNIGNEDIAEDILFFANKYIDFGLFDKNGNGALSTRELLIIIIVAGYEASYGTASGAAACAPSVWSHVAAFDEEKAPIQDGVRLASSEHNGAYAQSGEWHCTDDDEPGHASTIGVLAHEIGHLLGEGAPDLYDRDGSSAGVGNWDLMGNGAWNGLQKPGDRPAHMSAWTKYYFGWVTPKLVTAPIKEAAIRQAEISSEGIYQLLENANGNDWASGETSGKGEYFLIENRQKVGYDVALPSAGLLIWHVDESQSGNQEDRRKLLDLVEASREQDLDCVCNENFGDATDPFPGENNFRAFDDQTAPNARLYTGLPSRIAISQISDSAATMTADFSVTQLKPGDPWLIFDETFEAGEANWLAFDAVELMTSTLCAGAALPASRVWYFGDSEICRYAETAQLESDERPLPEGTTKLTIQLLSFLDINKQDRVEFQISFDGGSKWRRVWTGRQPTKKEWKTITVNAAIPRNVGSVMLRFALIKTLRSTGGRGWFIDNVKATASGPKKKTSVSSSSISSIIRQNQFNLSIDILKIDEAMNTLSEIESVQLEIFNLSGQLLFSAQGDENASVVKWHLEDKQGRPVPNGIYLYVIRARDREGQLITTRVQKIFVAR